MANGKQSHDKKYGRLDSVKIICPYCSHNKAWKKRGVYECTRCKQRFI